MEPACAQCKKRPCVPGKKSCEHCLTNMRILQQIKRNKRRLSNMCLDCGMKPAKYGRYCLDHKMDRKAAFERITAKKRATHIVGELSCNVRNAVLFTEDRDAVTCRLCLLKIEVADEIEKHLAELRSKKSTNNS